MLGLPSKIFEARLDEWPRGLVWVKGCLSQIQSANHHRLIGQNYRLPHLIQIPNMAPLPLTISPQSIANHSKLIPELPLSEPPIHFLQQVHSLQTTQPKSPVGFSLISLMASATAISLALPMVAASPVSQRDALKPKQAHGSSLFTTPNKLYSPRLASSRSRVVMHASQSKKEQSLAGLTSLVLASTMVIPEIAEAAGSGVSPSLKNFLLSIAAGGVVATLIAGAVVGVSNFDPVKRN